MSTYTKIQWADSTVNPVMGCGGCELFPEPKAILNALDETLSAAHDNWKPGHARKLFKTLIDETWNKMEKPDRDFSRGVSTTNIYHLRQKFSEQLEKTLNSESARQAKQIIETHITCYAAKQHLNRGNSIENPTRRGISGYAPYFERLTLYPDRVKHYAKDKTTAQSCDLLGTVDPENPWKDKLPRLIFVSDMGDAFSRTSDFGFLQKNVIEAIISPQGRKHIWLWLTKRPDKMAMFTRQHGPFPKNICAMTTLTGASSEQLERLKQLKKVKASSYGLSIEPLRERIPPEKLHLSGIDWVILGGESGSKEYSQPFDLSWARELRDHCKKSNTAFFMKQLGARPVEKGTPIFLKDSHGGNWDEWEDTLADLRIREFPNFFHDYRKNEMPNGAPLPRRPTKKTKNLQKQKLGEGEHSQFKELDRVVSRAAQSFVDAGFALLEIKERKLYRAKFDTFPEYCSYVHDISKQYANKLIRAGLTYRKVETIVSTLDLPIISQLKNEAQLRELDKLKDPEKQKEVLIELSKENTNGKLTAKDIQVFVARHLPPKPAKTTSKQSKTQIHADRHEIESALKKLEAVLRAKGDNWQEPLKSLKALLN